MRLILFYSLCSPTGSWASRRQWVALFNRLPSVQTSRNAWTSHAPFLLQTVTWSRMHPSFQFIWVPWVCEYKFVVVWLHAPGLLAKCIRDHVTYSPLRFWPTDNLGLGVKTSDVLHVCVLYLWSYLGVCWSHGYSAVKYQMKLHGKTLKPGDVLMTNSPHAGGS